MKRLILVGLVAASTIAGARAFYVNAATPAPTISTARVTTGNIVTSVTATGTLQAVTTVQVGTQVSGTVEWLGADFNSLVRKGQMIARLDTSLIDAQIEQARATVARTTADRDSSRVRLEDARQKYERASSLAGRQLLARSDLDTARVAVDSAAAQLKASDAQVIQAEAALNQTLVSRAHTVIASPIDGIVISRNVDAGQTVAASLSSPTIFTIAADLTKMQVLASIDESDIGRIARGQQVTFQVDAYPNRSFEGVVTQVRLQPAVVQNVTTYSVMIDAPNGQLDLKPGMTATVHVEIARRDNVARIPNAALRFRPTADTAPLLGVDPITVTTAKVGHSQVWARIDSVWTAVAVTPGLSDGQTTELVEGTLPPGTELLVSVSTAEAPTRAAASPLGGLMGTPGRPPGLDGPGAARGASRGTTR